MSSPKELVSALAAGDRSALREIYELYKNKVFNTAISYLQNTAEAEEATQDVFFEVYRSASSFEGRSEVSTWIYRIAINKCLDRIRSRDRSNRGNFLNRMLHLGAEEVRIQAIEFVHPGIEFERREDSKLLFAAIDSLPDQQKTAFILRHIEGLSQREAAEVMKTTVKAFESLLQRAKAALRKKLSELTEGNL